MAENTAPSPNVPRDFSIIIPTYNEHESIPPLLKKIHQQVGGRNYEIIFVDDDSRDGTADLINSLSGDYPVRVVVRKGKRGLATAVADGFDYSASPVLLVMDADLQHPPEVIPALLQSMDTGADIAVASRYVPGGGNLGWSKTRQVISNGAILLSHLLLPSSRRVKDPMSGFFALKRSVVSGLKLEPIGYKILLEVIVLAEDARVTEVPFMFQVREQGKSKLNLNQQMEYLKHLLSLMRRSGEMLRFLKFALVGGSGVLVNEGTRLILTTWAGMAYPYDAIAAPIGIELSIITNFVLNNYFTFSDRRAKGAGAFFRRLVKFNVISLVGAAIQYGIYLALTRGAGWVEAPFPTLANLIGIAIAMAWNFFSNSWWTWKK
jgi:dolichol-phosphate mannosyltransferase